MKQTFIKSAMLLLLILSTATTRAQEVALKTNLLGWASTSANAGIEIGTGKKTTFQLFGTLNPWKFSGDKKMRFWNVMPEYRWYTCQKFGGHFFGIHALGGEYNIKNIDMPFGILPKTLEGRHYEGWYVGGGLTYGYQWLLNKHLNFEGSIGLGYAYSPLPQSSTESTLPAPSAIVVSIRFITARRVSGSSDGSTKNSSS